MTCGRFQSLSKATVSTIASNHFPWRSIGLVAKQRLHIKGAAVRLQTCRSQENGRHLLRA